MYLLIVLFNGRGKKYVEQSFYHMVNNFTRAWVGVGGCGCLGAIEKVSSWGQLERFAVLPVASDRARRGRERRESGPREGSGGGRWKSIGAIGGVASR